MKQIDRLYMWSLILTVGASSLMFTGMLLPNWWIQKARNGITTRIFGLYGKIHCSDDVCYPSDQLPITLFGVPEQFEPMSTPTTNPPGSSGSTSTTTTDPVEGNVSESSSVSDSTTVPDNTGSTAGNDSTEESSNGTTLTPETSTSPESTSVSPTTTTTTPQNLQPISVEHPANAAWLVGGRVMGGIAMVLVMITLLLQMAFMLFPHYRFEYVSLGFLVAAALVSFITGFIFISKFSALSRVYANERPPGALSYTSAAPGCILICSLLCVVAAVFTMMALRPPGSPPPKPTISQRKTTGSAPGTEPNETGEVGDAETLLA